MTITAPQFQLTYATTRTMSNVRFFLNYRHAHNARTQSRYTIPETITLKRTHQTRRPASAVVTAFPIVFPPANTTYTVKNLGRFFLLATIYGYAPAFTCCTAGRQWINCIIFREAGKRTKTLPSKP